MTRRPRRSQPPETAAELRIIGGEFRGRKLSYVPLRTGDDLVTRPMKHRVREAIFNLVGLEARGRHAVDLFAGTGALGLEALSRGAAYATFVEKHVPTARVVEANLAALAVEGRARLHATSAFLWGQRDAATLGTAAGPPGAPIGAPWLVFCSPPYSFYAERLDDMLALVQNVLDAAPGESIVVVEADERFDFDRLPTATADGAAVAWDVRTYLPAIVGVGRKA